jgi:phage terminase Nu1 subunit (DNA packaging protein)
MEKIKKIKTLCGFYLDNSTFCYILQPNRKQKQRQQQIMKKNDKNKIMRIGTGIYRGIFTEIAQELGVTPDAVRMGYKRNSPRYIGLILEKIRERKKIAAELQKETGEEIIPAEYMD